MGITLSRVTGAEPCATPCTATAPPASIGPGRARAPRDGGRGARPTYAPTAPRCARYAAQMRRHSVVETGPALARWSR